ncbi:hypothetical protein DLAC_00919 [Tieghemostelium lacteum]|uniref:Uncharacterized protein n=1 Tax=Tieghemostelium lacteum TaxID=361077 RepID=A0A152A7B9_TIELA|nr:hypothetical protein DLAC_00919 [Tieghemostelium lacteum]|eukprot:KYR02119.1 hypothetical protein DLAC_00919 [Tieghemostelium lacteum]
MYNKIIFLTILLNLALINSIKVPHKSPIENDIIYYTITQYVNDDCTEPYGTATIISEGVCLGDQNVALSTFNEIISVHSANETTVAIAHYSNENCDQSSQKAIVYHDFGVCKNGIIVNATNGFPEFPSDTFIVTVNSDDCSTSLGGSAYENDSYDGYFCSNGTPYGQHCIPFVGCKNYAIGQQCSSNDLVSIYCNSS